MKIMHIKTTDNRDYSFPVANSLEAAKTLLTLKKVGIFCKWWRYEEG